MPLRVLGNRSLRVHLLASVAALTIAGCGEADGSSGDEGLNDGGVFTGGPSEGEGEEAGTGSSGETGGSSGESSDDGTNTSAEATATTLGETSVGDGDGDASTGDGDGDAGTGDGDGDTSSGDGDGDGDTSGDGDGDGDGGPVCLSCDLTIASMQSGALNITGSNIFGTATLAGQVVYAFGTQGAGRFILSADSSLPFKEVSDCPIQEWLSGGSSAPSILVFGWGPSDGPGNWPAGATIAGVNLPVQYIGNPALLKTDYDIVLYLEGSSQFPTTGTPADAEMQTIVDYVSIHGGGAYVSSEFANSGGSYLNADDIASVNRIMIPFGAEALQVSLAWGGVDGEIAFSCFPIPQ